jgi:hypothetical protein
LAVHSAVSGVSEGGSLKGDDGIELLCGGVMIPVGGEYQRALAEFGPGVVYGLYDVAVTGLRVVGGGPGGGDYTGVVCRGEEVGDRGDVLGGIHQGRDRGRGDGYHDQRDGG